MFKFPILVGDIGATYSRFAVMPAPDEPLSRLVLMVTSAHRTPTAAIGSTIDELGGQRPRSALLGLAGRVDASVVRLTNAPWIIDAAKIGSDLSLAEVTLVNDYIPVAAALPLLQANRPNELVRIGRAAPCREGVRVAAGPGTGLGAAACVPLQGRYWLHPTEAGHISFGACEGEEFATWPLMDRVCGRISAEAVLSGPGLVRLHRAVARQRGEQPTCGTPAEVIAEANTGQGGAAFDALHLFLRLLGRFAGDLALVFGASGGVFFGGGILPRVLNVLERSELRLAFEQKAPFEAVMQQIPTFVITNPEPAMIGLTSIALQPDRFIFESHGWIAP